MAAAGTPSVTWVRRLFTSRGTAAIQSAQRTGVQLRAPEGAERPTSPSAATLCWAASGICLRDDPLVGQRADAIGLVKERLKNSPDAEVVVPGEPMASVWPQTLKTLKSVAPIEPPCIAK